MSWIKKLFLSPKGGLRAAWLVIIGYAAYYAWSNGITLAMSCGFGELFDMWGLTRANIEKAPAWARIVSEYYGVMISVVVSVGICAFSYLAFRKRTSVRFSGRMFGISTAAGLAAAGICAGLMLALDSLRLVSARAEVTFEPVAIAAVAFLGCAAEEFFVRRYVFSLVWERAGTAAAHITAAGVFLLTSAITELTWLGIVNTLLMSVVLCEISRRRGAWAAIGARFGWSVLITCVLAFPGQTAAGHPLWQMYSVSEEWLTGGESGLICGLFTTILLTAALGIILRKQVPSIIRFLPRGHSEKPRGRQGYSPRGR